MWVAKPTLVPGECTYLTEGKEYEVLDPEYAMPDDAKPIGGEIMGDDGVRVYAYFPSSEHLRGNHFKVYKVNKHRDMTKE